MLNPFQCILFCSRLKQELPSIILAASGSSIYSIGSSNGALLSIWPRQQLVDDITNADSAERSDITSERPEKRRKLSACASSESSSAEIVVENGEKRKRRSRGRFMGAGIPAVIKLIGTSNGNHAIAVTGEDKCIRVFDILDDGSIEQISQRAMPKRPCSIALTTDEKSVLCADKFGDVYALPFEDTPLETHLKTDASQSPKAHVEAVEKKFTPAANSLTVHTKTNRQALLNQKNAMNRTAEKKVLEFAHGLLLGHVSLLTDLAYVTVPSTVSNGSKSRDYIITADRDEHIRVSRGLPQSHVIENYCLGHTSFVSKLCVPKGKTNLLISGGGDDYFLLWDWLAGRIIQKIEILAILNAHRPKHSAVVSASSDKKELSLEPSSTNKVSISGLWAIQLHTKDEHLIREYLMVACEGVPALLVYDIVSEYQLEFRDYLHFQSNVLDLTHDIEQGTLLVTLDNAHQPWSMDQLRERRGNELLASCSYSMERGRWTILGEAHRVVAAFNKWAEKAEHMKGEGPLQKQPLRDVLYGIENLRKRGNEE